MPKYLLSFFLTAILVTPSLSIAQKSNLSVNSAWIRAPIDDTSQLSLYFNIYNQGEQTDYLIDCKADISNKTIINKTVRINGINKTVVIEKVALPPKTEVKFQPLGIYLVIKNVSDKITKGDDIKVSLFFTKSGLIEFIASVK